MSNTIVDIESGNNLFTLIYAERPSTSDALATLNGPSTHKNIAGAIDELYGYVKGRVLDCVPELFIEWIEDEKPDYLFVEAAVLSDKVEYALERFTGADEIKEVVDWYFNITGDDTAECFYKIEGHNVNSFEEHLISLITDVQNTGGLIEFSDGLFAPAADPTWTDIGQTIFQAHSALESNGITLRMNIEDVGYSSKEAE